MATQGGLKHAATEPSHLDNKRSVRRRGVGAGIGAGAGAGGAGCRTAALRRAPSDSDCSGETASLSADSNERLRPAPPPPRANKTRSRRRGSEWEVLEGLKDGQRFERRPEVFNGYLHKKRKWPLKGWHKRFFVIDGGILVYARSPGDVSRGRLHGSVDVGLSVISAKARRRRIDIDADEFIYHLRAKTPDVFRTWLNVLKVHRLYRQHLLTFGARESVPKIHPPLEEIPQTENTSRISSLSLLTYSTEDSRFFKIEKRKKQDESYANNSLSNKYNQTSNLPKENLVSDWEFFENTDHGSELIPLNFEPLEEEIAVVKPDTYTHSMCSMKCMARLYEKDLEELKKSPNDSSRATETEKQVDVTELDRHSLKTDDQFVDSIFAYSFNSVDCDRAINRVINNNLSNSPPFPERNEPYRIPDSSPTESLFFEKKVEPTTALFLFARKKHRRPKSSEHNMKRSRKSTNLVKYRNVADEPCLKIPPSNCILLKRNRVRLSEQMVEIVKNVNAEVQVAEIKEDKSSQDVMRAFEYDELAAKLVTKIFNERSSLRHNANRGYDVQYYVNQMVKELYDVKISQAHTHPVKVLFKCLLEFWLKNTNEVNMKSAVKRVKSIDVQSSEYFTKDQNLSGLMIERATKETQYYAYEAGMAFETKMVDKKRQLGPIRPTTNSFVKERRIQELERILKSTVYTCDTVCGNRSIEKDIAITRKLIDNLGSMQKSDVLTSNEEAQDNSNPSSEFPVIQETFNNFLNETAIPTDVMKEFLGAYLEVLINNSTSPDDNTTSTNDTKTSTDSPKCDVEAESIQNKVSKGITTNESNETTNNQDSEQKCLKDLLDKITQMFSKLSKGDYNKNNIDKQVQPDDTKVEGSFKEAIERNELPDKNIISENKDENSIVVDLTKFDLEHISLLNDPKFKGMMSISITLKERTPNIGESKHKKLNLKFSDNTPNRIENQELYLTSDSSGKNCQRNNFDTRISFKNPYTDCNPTIQTDDITLRPYISCSDATSKAYRRNYESDHSLLDVTMKNASVFDSYPESKKAFNCHEDVQSCYVLSSVTKSGMFSSSQTKKKIRLKESNEPLVGPSEKNCNEYAPKVIDEKFILLLLENLTLLSQNIPEIHKDINSLYEKLKKKHGKDLKYTEKSLGLLGKIYQKHEEKEFNDATNFDVSVKVEKPIKIASSNVENGINTSEKLFGFKNLVDRSTSVYLVVTEVKEFEIQTDDEPRKKERKSVSFVDENTSICTKDLRNEENCHCLNVKAEVDKNDVACCTPNWFTESGIGTTVKYILNNEGSCQNFRIVPQSDAKFKNDIPNVRYVLNTCNDTVDRKTTQDAIEKNLWANIRRDPVGDRHLDPDKRLNFFLKNNKALKRDFNVYQLFVSNKFQATLSSSMSSSNLEVLKSGCSEMKTIYRCKSDPSLCSESGGSLENASRELGQAQLSVQQLQRLLEALELQQHHHDTDVFDKVSLEGASPSVKKDRRKFGLRKKKSSSKCASVELAPHYHVDGSTSHMALSALTAPPSPGGGASSMPNSAASLPIACAAARPQSLPGPNTETLVTGPASISSLTPDHQLREDFTVLAKDLVSTLKGVVNTLVCERGRLRAAMDTAEGGGATPAGPMLATLRTNLNSALQQNSELRSRLSRIHDASDLAEVSSVNNTDPAVRQFQQSLSYSSSCVSASEFFDAEEHDDQPQDILPNDEAGVIELDGDSSSEAGSLSSEEGSASSDNSDGALASAEPITVRLKNGGGSSSGEGGGGGGGGGEVAGWSRRTRLPCPRPTPGGPSLWNLLYKNIGKDLSQVSMPVTINEPLNMLQRLCEELEYSELLDMASNTPGEMERMSLVAAFAVSAYAASAHRAASKPFNPLLAETYECVRPDKGFRFLAEQVSHHPPVSACHAESARWCVWQEARIKTKFWGKSMEFQPAGRVHLRLLPQGDHYEWNKVTTCVHNLFGGQRWVDQYGDMIITCHGTDITAKLNFIKASSWSSGRHEVRGAVYSSGGARLRLHGRWSEALYAGDPPSAKCLWRPGAMPPEHEMYYGFTRFAMELNEMEPGMRDVLPHTDTRLRPDQRALEEGDVDAAERYKHQLEQAQRDRRRHSPEHTPCWFRKSTEGGEEMWVFTGEYWRARDAGFRSRAAAAASSAASAPAIW